MLAALVAGLSLPGLLNGQDDKEQPTGKTVVLGRRLSTPVALDLPKGASVTADDSYVGVQFSAGGWVLVTVPQEVYEPDGTRDPMPPDPATWLRSHPDVFVSGSRMVEVDGKSAVQIDYRRSSMAQPQSRYARLPLFCGWRGSEYYGSSSSAYRTSTQTSSRECTQITDDAGYEPRSSRSKERRCWSRRSGGRTGYGAGGCELAARLLRRSAGRSEAAGRHLLGPGLIPSRRANT